MKDIIPFKNEIIFDTNISEITSISLDNTLSINGNNLCGDFIISGEYKETSDGMVIPFSKKIPFNTYIDNYDTSKATIDIDDFYYEVNNNILSISIDVLLDNLEVNGIEPVREENILNDSNFNTESYVEYNIYILRNGDTIDTILDKYNTTIEALKDYNNLDDLKLGDKIIIPNSYESN